MDSIENFDVCIIGGNIAGAYIAYLLAKENIKVVVIEEHSETGVPIQCAGIISQKIAKIIDLDSNCIQNRVGIARLIAPDGTKMDMRGREKPYILDRALLDQSFFHKAKKFGAKFYFNEKFRTYKKIKDSGVLVETNKKKIRSKLIIGCDGPFSKVARLNGVKNKIIYGMQIRAKYEISQGVTEMYFDPRWKESFGWIISESDDPNGICRIGMGCLTNPGPNYNLFLKKKGIKKEDVINRQGGVIPFGYINRIGFDRAILLGDSGCMVKATTGGGVVMLLSAAKVAKVAIIKAIKTEDFSEKFFVRNYERHPVMLKLKAELRVHYFIRIILMRLKTEDFNWVFSLYKSTNIKEIVQRYADMDFPKKLIFKLLKNKDFNRFLIHILFRNIKMIPSLIKLAAGNQS